MIYAFKMHKISYYKYLFLSLNMVFFCSQSIEIQPKVTVPINHLDSLPFDLLGYILGFMEVKEVNRFLRTAKKYYNSKPLTSSVMTQIHSRYFPPLMPVENWMYSARDIGTPTASAVLRDYVIGHPEEAVFLHSRFGWAVAHNQEREVKIFKNAGADLNSIIDVQIRETVFLNLSQDFCKLKHLISFLDAGADINSTDKFGNNVLMRMIRDNRQECILQGVLFLVEHINLNYTNHNGETAFQLAVNKGYGQITQAIMKASIKLSDNNSIQRL